MITWIRSAKLSSCRLLLVPLPAAPPDAPAGPDVEDEAVVDEDELGVEGVAALGDCCEDVEGTGGELVPIIPGLDVTGINGGGSGGGIGGDFPLLLLLPALDAMFTFTDTTTKKYRTDECLSKERDSLE